MKMRREMQKKAAVFITVIGMCSALLSGCGSDMQTREEIIIPKESENGVAEKMNSSSQDAASGNIAEQIQVPERYQAEISSEGISIKIDAALFIPDVPGIKTKKVSSRLFTQEDYDAVSMALLDGAPLWVQDYNVETTIREIPAIVDAEPSSDMPSSEENGLGGYVTLNGQNYYVDLRNIQAEAGVAAFTVEKKNEGSNYLFSFNNPTNADAVENLQTSTEEILEKAEAALKQAGLREYIPQGGEYFTCFRMTQTRGAVIDKSAYGIRFARVIDGIPINYVHTENPNVFLYPEKLSGSSDIYVYTEGKNASGIGVSGEEITLIYDDEGFNAFIWKAPCEVEDLSSEAVFLMPFTDIQDIFEKMILKKMQDAFGEEGDSIEVAIDEVRLGYMQFRENGSAEDTLIPVWDFYGTETFQNAAGETYFSKDGDFVSVLTINAMDGTVVSREDSDG